MGLFPKDRNLAAPPEEVEIPVRASDFRVRPAELEIRLDAFLQRFLHWRSRSSIQDLIKEGHVLVDVAPPERPGEKGTPRVERRVARRLRHGARVVVRIPEELRVPVLATADAGALRVLYEDEDVLAVDKPPLLPVHPSGRHLADTLIQRIHAVYARGDERGGTAIRLCHRLDRETSGVVLCAKERRAHARLMRQFERRTVEKEYLAAVHGAPREERGVVELPLGSSHTSRVHLRMAVVPGGLPARTAWEVRERHGPFTLLACFPETGRQHQIRVHLAAIGHPIVGDKLYGLGEEYFLRDAAGALTRRDVEALGMPRHALHNHRLGFRSPRSGEWTEVRSPLAADVRELLEGA